MGAGCVGGWSNDAMITDRFHGRIAGMGTTSGVRIVVGRWSDSPLGPFADVMLERADGHRLLLAPDRPTAEFIADTYVFDEVRLTPVSVTDPAPQTWLVRAAELHLEFHLGGRPALGRLLRLVPRTLAAQQWWNRVIDPIARRLLPGVRTTGTARSGRREYYGAHDQQLIDSLTGQWEGGDLGTLAAVDPPVRFGFSSTPSMPSVTSVITTVVTDGR
jgi:hypothetical protein